MTFESFSLVAQSKMPLLLRIATRLTGDRETARDLVQDALLKAFCARETYDPARCQFTTWMGTVIKNCYIDSLRKKRAPTVLFSTLEAHLPEGCTYEPPDTKEGMKAEEYSATILEALEKVDERYRRALVMYEEEEKDYAEIAKILHIPISTVKTWIFRARRMLQKELWMYAEARGYPSPVTVSFTRKYTE